MATLYAEFLPNIKALSITTVLDTPRDQSTSLCLSGDRFNLILEHGHKTYRITLPAKVPGQGTRHLQLPNTGEFQCINRISAESNLSDEEVIIPWSASALNIKTELHCKSCSVIVSNSKINVWKDLPSEAWAEMMDLWHCHKPPEPSHSEGDATTGKGYAAGNKLLAQTGTGFVDVMSFLLAEEDCTGIEIQTLSEDNTEAPSVICTSCKTTIGFFDSQTQGIRLQKLHLSLSSLSSPSRSFPLEQWFSCYLLSAIESQGVRKFVFATLALELWVLSTNIAFSSLDSPAPTSGIKVLFKGREKSDGNDIENLRKENLLIETLTLSPRLEVMLEKCLKERNQSLPTNLRNFLDWNVAVLPKFRNEDIA